MVLSIYVWLSGHFNEAETAKCAAVYMTIPFVSYILDINTVVRLFIACMYTLFNNAACTVISNYQEVLFMFDWSYAKRGDVTNCMKISSQQM